MSRRQSDLEDLTASTVVVTGASGAIGRALGSAFAARGANLVLVDLEEPAPPDGPSGGARGGVEALCLAGDVTSPRDLGAVHDAALDAFGRVDVLCNNAGVGGRLGPMWELPVGDWDQVLGVNLLGVVHGVRAFVPTMIRQGRGHVVNTASMAGLLPMPFGTPYVASKHAVVGLTATLRWELGQSARGVSASVLCPGWTRSGIATGPGAGLLDGHEAGPAGAMAQLLASNVERGMAPAEVAERVVQAVQGDEFWILTHPDQAAAVLPHYEGAVASADPA